MTAPLNVLVLGPGHHREAGLSTLRAAGHRVGVVDELSAFPVELADWWSPIPPGALRNPVEVVASSGIQWDVALVWGELTLGPSLAMAEALGVPCARLDVECLRDKGVMRARQRAAGLLVPEHVVVEDAHMAADWVGGRYPVVVKPVDYGGSSGVRCVNSDPELEQAVRRALAKSFAGRAIVEAMVVGPEYSIETISFGAGRHHSYAVVAKTLTPLPFRVELGHDVPADLPTEVAGLIVDEVHRTLDALGMTVGASHAEVKLSGGVPYVIEVGGRLGGDFIPQLVRLAYGVDLYREELRAILGGEPPTTQAVATQAAAMRVLHAPVGGVLRWPDGDVIVGTALERTLRDLHHWYPDNTPVPVVDSSARRLGSCVLAGEPAEVAAACDAVGLLGPNILPETS